MRTVREKVDGAPKARGYWIIIYYGRTEITWGHKSNSYTHIHVDTCGCDQIHTIESRVVLALPLPGSLLCKHLIGSSLTQQPPSLLYLHSPLLYVCLTISSGWSYAPRLYLCSKVILRHEFSLDFLLICLYLLFSPALRFSKLPPWLVPSQDLFTFLDLLVPIFYLKSNSVLVITDAENPTIRRNKVLPHGVPSFSRQAISSPTQCLQGHLQMLLFCGLLVLFASESMSIHYMSM